MVLSCLHPLSLCIFSKVICGYHEFKLRLNDTSLLTKQIKLRVLFVQSYEPYFSQVTIVSEGLITTTGIAIDWYTEKIYWADGETNRIEVIGIEQKHRKVLFWSEVDLARAIAVVPNKG